MLRQRNLKKQLYFYVRPIVHTNPSQKRSFWKTLFKPDEFENADLNCGRKTFWKRSFLKPISRQQSRGLPDRVLLNFKSTVIGYCCAFKFLWCSVDGEHLMSFQSETSVFNFLQRRWAKPERNTLRPSWESQFLTLVHFSNCWSCNSLYYLEQLVGILSIFFSKVRHLEETGAALAEDLIQKSAIIQAYAMETKIGEVFQTNQ